MENTEYALIPHKDQLLVLSNYQRDFIKLYNQPKNEISEFAIPLYPLWVISNYDFKNNEKNYISCKVEKILIFEKTAFFEIYLKTKNETMIYKIPFAKNINSENIEFILNEKNPFPLNLRVFRTGIIKRSPNTLSLFNEKWISIKNS